MTTTTNRVDWEAVEALYRAGVLSLREIGSQHGVTEGAIRKRAKRDDWARDLAAKVQAKADDLVRKAEVRKTVRAASLITDRVLIEANAQVIAEVRSAHRGDIKRFRALAASMLSELEIETGNVELFEELGEILRSEDKAGQDKRNDIYRKVISSAGRIDSMKKLAETLRILIALEREAYGIQSESEKASTSMADVLSELVASLPD